jgi:ATP-dependent NAD(P)H-hydrate dehydratase
MASLRGGGELAHIFCSKDAAPAIRSFSPDLIVHPDFGELLSDEESMVENTLARFHAVVLGPGLGRGATAKSIVQKILATKVDVSRPDVKWPLVLDADALYFLANDKDMLQNLRASGRAASTPPVYLTPNVVELTRLCDKAGVQDAAGLVDWLRPEDGSNSLVIVVAKGDADQIVRSVELVDIGRGSTVAVKTHGTKKRCGGQGDILAGLTAVYAAWAARFIAEHDIDGATFFSDIYMSACVASSSTTRRASALAFEALGRSMIASDMLGFVGRAFEEIVNHRKE